MLCYVNMPKSCEFFCIKLVVLFYLTSRVVGWDSDDLELFDLVEEVNENFYDVLGVSPVRKLWTIMGYRWRVHNVSRCHILRDFRRHRYCNRVSHSCILLKLLDGMRWLGSVTINHNHLADCVTGSSFPYRKRRFGARNVSQYWCVDCCRPFMIDYGTRVFCRDVSYS